MDHVLPWGESPIDLPEEAPAVAVGASAGLARNNAVDDPASGGKSGVGWVCGVIASSSLALFAFNSHALANWADQLPVVPATAPLTAFADSWHAQAERLGLNDIVNRVERAAAAMRNAPWPQRNAHAQIKDGRERPASGGQR